MKYKPLPPLEELKEFLDYNPDIGIFTWIKARSRIRVGQEAGSTNSKGYKTIMFNQENWQLSRIAYYIYYGIDPLENEIDHEDGNPANNKVDNLRFATRKENAKNKKLSKNNTSGKTGVVWVGNPSKGRPYWKCDIGVDGKQIHLGCFKEDKKEDAIKAREEAEIKYFGDFRRKD